MGVGIWWASVFRVAKTPHPGALPAARGDGDGAPSAGLTVDGRHTGFGC